MPTVSKNFLFTNPKLPFGISENGKQMLFENKNAMDMGMTILERLKDSATWDFAEIPTQIRHESIEFTADFFPRFSVQQRLVS